jgi:hypothetical protein
MKAGLSGSYQSSQWPCFSLFYKRTKLTLVYPEILDFIKNIIIRSLKRNHDRTHIARWLRCLFQVSVLTASTLALECITHATSLAASPPLSSAGQPGGEAFPQVELEWLAASTFNHAIDFYSAGDDENFNLWATSALQLAEKATDGGVLAGLLRVRYSKLSWQADEQADGMMLN